MSNPNLIGFFIRSNVHAPYLDELCAENMERMKTFVDYFVSVYDNLLEIKDAFQGISDAGGAEEGNYVWIQYDLDWVDDPSLVRTFFNMGEGRAFYTERYVMIEDEFYDAADVRGQPQLIPYKKGEAQFYQSQPPMPKYAFDLPSIKEPRIKVLDYYEYGRDNHESRRKSDLSLALSEWTLGSPTTLVADPNG